VRIVATAALTAARPLALPARSLAHSPIQVCSSTPTIENSNAMAQSMILGPSFPKGMSLSILGMTLPTLQQLLLVQLLKPFEYPASKLLRGSPKYHSITTQHDNNTESFLLLVQRARPRTAHLIIDNTTASTLKPGSASRPCQTADHRQSPHGNLVGLRV
jgi:hypothetical protein